MRYFLFLLFFLLTITLNAQGFSKEALQKLEDEELLDLFNKVNKDSIKAEKVARTYLNRARKEGDTIKMARGYDRLARLFKFNKSIQFSDSIIILTKNKKHITYPTMGYLLKALELMDMYDDKNALSNLLIANQYSKTNKNPFLTLFIELCIIDIKELWGDPGESLKLSKAYYEIIKNTDFKKLLKKSSRKNYKIKTNEHIEIKNKNLLIALDRITTSYLYAKKYDSAFSTALIYQKKSLLFNNIKLYHSSISRLGEAYYYIKNYKNAIDSLLKGLKFRQRPSSILNDYQYIGLSYLYSDNKNKGVKYLKKADSIYNEIKTIKPSQTNLFKELYNYYKETDSTEKQIEYLNKLLIVDSIFKRNYLYIGSTIKREYEIPKLLKEKEELIASLQNKNKQSKAYIWWSFGLLGVMGLLMTYYVKKQQAYKKRFETLMLQQSSTTVLSLNTTKENEISSTIIDDILERLVRFEEQKRYLSQSVSLHNTAKQFKTNSSYLSKVINLKKDKNFSQYINDLRIEFTIEELSKNSKFRKYTIKAISEEVGFKNVQSFSKAFYKMTGLQPSYFIRKLNKKIS